MRQRLLSGNNISEAMRLQMRQYLADYKRIFNAMARHSGDDPGRAVFIGPNTLWRECRSRRRIPPIQRTQSFNVSMLQQ